MPVSSGKRARTPIYKISIGAAVSGTGSNMAAVAVSLDVFDRTDSALWLSVAMLGSFGLPGLLSPVAGYVADRVDRRLLMIVSSFAATLVWIGVAATDDKITLIVLISIANIVEVPYGLAANSAIPNLVDEDELTWATSWWMSGWNVGKLLGPALGAVAYAANGADLVYIANAVTFAVVALLVMSIRENFSADADADADSDSEAEPRGGLTAGFRLSAKDPVILRLLVFSLCASIAINSSFVTDVFLVHDFGHGAVAYGILGAVFGLGYLGGSMLSSKLSSLNEWPWVLRSAAVVALGWLAVGLTPWFLPVFVAVFVAAALSSVGGIMSYTLMQRRIDDTVRGRVLAVFEVIASAANLVGFAAAGVAVGVLGSQGVYVAGGLLVVLSLVALMTFRGDPYSRPAEPALMGSEKDAVG